MSEIILDVESRDVNKEPVKQLRRNGILPAVVYGHGKENKALKLNQKEFLQQFHGKIASNIFIDLKIDNEKAPSKTVLIKEVQRGCVSQEVEHIDFLEINPNEKISLMIPVVLTGSPIGLTFGGILEFVMRSLEVECLPADVPKEIKLDISGLNIGDSIHAGAIHLGEKIKTLTSSETTVVAVLAEKKEKEEVKPAAEAATPAEGEAAAAAPAEGAAKAPVKGAAKSEAAAPAEKAEKKK
ncbi:MAG: 50S ribosomal protein L25 [Candidatus Aureabacteria bacterium]|nr:50S ribosomal protein L25 [Candidatus Auribacterota bacterium]